MTLHQMICLELSNLNNKYKVLYSNGRPIKYNDSVMSITVELFRYYNFRLLSELMDSMGHERKVYIDEEIADTIITECKSYLEEDEGCFESIVNYCKDLDINEVKHDVEKIKGTFVKIKQMCEEGEEIYYMEY